IGIVWDLIQIATQRRHQAKLVPRIQVEDEGREPSIAVFGIGENLPDRRLETVIASIPVEAGEVGESFGVTAEINLVVGLIPIAEAHDKFGIVVSLKAGSRDDVKDPIRAIAVSGVVAAAFCFEVIDVLGIDLGAYVARNIRIGDGHAVDEPTDLVATADV